MKRKIMRKFVPVEIDGKPGKYDLIRREQPKPAEQLINVGPCPVCGQSLYVGSGQHIRFHKECRKEGRRRFGRSEHIVEVNEGGIVNQSYVAKK